MCVRQLSRNWSYNEEQNGQTPVYGRAGHGVENENLSRQALHITWGRESGEGFPRQRVEGECRYHSLELTHNEFPEEQKKVLHACSGGS